MQLASRSASRSRVLLSDSPLSDDQIHRVVPSIFAEVPHESRSERYACIPTTTVLIHTLLIRGFDPLQDVVDYGRELIPRIRAGIKKRAQRQAAAA